MSKILSIIIPAYNMELFIRQTLESMALIDLADDLDVCIINDGSKDSTAQIAQEFVEAYPQIFRLFNKENGGHGSALNMGIDVAMGKYYRPIDADDWVEAKALREVVSALKKLDNDVDMVITNFRKVLVQSNKTINVRCKNIYNMKQVYNGEFSTQEGRELNIYGKVYDFDKDLFDYSPQYLYHFVSYRTALLKENKIKFDEHCYYDDMEYDIFPLAYVKTVLPLDFYLYQYRLEREGQSVDEKSFIKNRQQRRKIVESICKYIVVNKEKFGANVYKCILDDVIWKIKRQYEIYFNMPASYGTLKEIMQFDAAIKQIDHNLYINSAVKTIKLLRISHGSLYWLLKCIKDIKKKKIKKKEFKEQQKKKCWTIASDYAMHKEIWKRYVLKFFHLDRFYKPMRAIQQYKNIHKGERCFITCTGPSLTIKDLEKLDDEYTIGMNSIIKAYGQTDWRCSYYCLVDYYAFGEYLKNNPVDGGRFCNLRAFMHYRVDSMTKAGNELYCPINYANHKQEWMKKNKIKISSDISVCFYDCFTATIMAIQLAIYMGFKKIYIIGADCDYSKQQIHFIEMPDDKIKIAGGWLPNAVDLSLNGYRAVKLFAERHGVEIVNVTRGGKLEIFKRDTLENIIGEEK